MVQRRNQKALSGGRDTLEEHRKKGAVVEKDMCFELLKQHLIEDDKELNKIYHAYKSGKMTSGEIKQITIEKMEIFMNNFIKGVEKAKKQIITLKFVKFK